jgi:nucleotide-binding universal stress UspA family protein
MSSHHDLLLAIDDTEASRKAIDYVAGVVRDAPQFRIRLLHVLPHIPTGLLEHGGRDTPEEERAAQRELDEGIARWRRRSERAAEALIEDARDTLEAAGVARDQVQVDFAAPLPEETIGFHVLKVATDVGADTVVVGRAPRSWIGGAFHRSPSVELFRRKGRGMAIWVVT